MTLGWSTKIMFLLTETKRRQGLLSNLDIDCSCKSGKIVFWLKEVDTSVLTHTQDQSLSALSQSYYWLKVLYNGPFKAICTRVKTTVAICQLVSYDSAGARHCCQAVAEVDAKSSISTFALTHLSRWLLEGNAPLFY